MPQSAAHASPRAQHTKCKNAKIKGFLRPFASICKITVLLRLFTNYYKAFAIYHAIMAICRQFITK